MKDTDYAYAVARIRANERYFLKQSDIDALISAKDFSAAAAYLQSVGWADSSKLFDLTEAVDEQNKRVWTLLKESVPDITELEVFTAETDFYNLKCAVKCMLTGDDAKKFFSYPTSLDLNELEERVKLHEFDKLPKQLSKTAEAAYEAACKTESGQLADVIIDRAALEYMLESAKKSRCDMVKEITDFLVYAANMKIAVRCFRTGKSDEFIRTALCPCSKTDVSYIASIADKGEAELLSYFEKSDYPKGAQLIEKDTVAFEKWVDDTVVEICKKAKYEFFGFSPICAYLYSKRSEIKSVRIILTAKESGLSAAEIQKRARELYV